MIRDLGNMIVEKEDVLKTDYVVLKINNNVFSSSYKEPGKDLKISMIQIVNTKGIGKQKNIWIKGFFTETKCHKQIKEVPFELNVYCKLEETNKNECCKLEVDKNG